MFVCLFAVNAKTTARIDAKRSGITKNDTESVLCWLKLPVLVFLERYRDISGFSFADDCHFYFSPYHFRLLPRLFTERFRQKRRRQRATSLLIICPTKETFTSWTKMLCLRPTNQASQANLHRQVHVHAGIPCKSNHYMYACIITLKHCHIVTMGMTLLQLPNSLWSR